MSPNATAYNIIRDPEDPRLHVASKKIGDPTSIATHRLAESLMVLANQVPNCVGLAAPQIGVNKRLIIVRHNNEWVPMANPRIVSQSEELIWGREGCLSHPGVFPEIARPNKVTVVASDITSGKEWKLTFFHNEDMHKAGYYPQLFRVLQHEIAHLDGTLITDMEGYMRDCIIDRRGMEEQIAAHVERMNGPEVEVDI